MVKKEWKEHEFKINEIMASWQRLRYGMSMPQLLWCWTFSGH